MKIWHWIQTACGLFGAVSVMITAPVSLVCAWIGWTRSDRRSPEQGWRVKALSAGLIFLTLGGVLYLATLSAAGWTKNFESAGQKAFLNTFCLTGVICCILAMLAAVLGRGRARIAVIGGGFFGLFMFAASTPFSILP